MKNQKIKKIIIQNKYYNVPDVRKHNDYLYIFGDNDVGVGKGGQAIIRDEPNAIGIPTKKEPNNRETAFYTDLEFEENKKKIHLSIVKVLKEFMKSKYTTLVLPAGGLGTGLSKLPEKAPKTFKYLEDKIKNLISLFK
jgi:hypothetical protein